MPIKITAQGGVGTAEEHQFLIDHYEVDSVGWGTPFLIVPEATTVDAYTLGQLVDATENELYLSGSSPFGIPFNNLKDSTWDVEKFSLAAQGKPGSACPRKLLVSNTEFTEKPICTASSKYQRLKIKQLDGEGLSPDTYKSRFDK
ncbi:MAG: hypothetical protein DRJ05_11210, partial [Bacteroidetes bacterium]